ncbi:MAG: hypothetical protein HRT89_16005 [Lentisphaeria bacterium]|nr:hypothetical protein [Lentisphaeria bacterium]
MNTIKGQVELLENKHKVECGWCGSLLHEGAQPASHGICKECLDEQLAIAKTLKKMKLL